MVCHRLYLPFEIKINEKTWKNVPFFIPACFFFSTTKLLLPRCHTLIGPFDQ